MMSSAAARFIGTVGGDIAYAWREFRRAPLTALTIVATLALGLSLAAVVFTVYNTLYLRVDAVADPEAIFEVRRPVAPGRRAWLPFTQPDYEALGRETNAFAGTAAVVRSVVVRLDGRATTGTLVTGSFFDTLGVRAARGRALAPMDDDAPSSNAVAAIVLSHHGWMKLFDGDAAAIGRRVRLNGVDVEVAGVMPPGFRGLAVAPPDFWAPLGLIGRLRPSAAGREQQLALEVVGRLNPGLSREAAAAALTAWAEGSPALTAVGGQPKTIALIPSRGLLSPDPADGLLNFAPLFIAFALVLLIGCANVANLLLARGVARRKEIGIRLALGAARRRVMRLLLTESLLLGVAAAATALVLSRALLDLALRIAVATMPANMAELVSVASFEIDWRVVAFLIGATILSTLLFGLAPALQGTRLELVRTLRGELLRDLRPGRARAVLVSLQVGASALLLVCAAVFLRGALAAAAADTGMRTGDTIFVEIASEPPRAAMLSAVAGDPVVAAAAAQWPLGIRGSLAEIAPRQTAGGAGPAARSAAEYKLVSSGYFDVLGIELLRGRRFTDDEQSADARVIVVSESTAKRLWREGDAVGQEVTFTPWAPAPAAGRAEAIAAPKVAAGSYIVVGVVRDVRVGAGLFQTTGAGVYVPAAATTNDMSIVARVHGDPDRAREHLTERLMRIDPALGRIQTVRSVAGLGAYVLQSVFRAAIVIGLLALAMTVSGLFSTLAYVVEQRTSEIGIRMALGAGRGRVVGLVLRDSLWSVGAGLAAGCLLAAGLATVIMSTGAAAQIGTLIPVLDPIAYGTSVLVIVACCIVAASVPALRAARVDPMTTLRRE